MNLLVRMLGWYTPVFVKRWALLELFHSTAQAFGHELPACNRSFDQCLRAYAQFTALEVKRALGRGDDLVALEDRLWHNAHRLGKRLRTFLHLARTEDAMRLARLLYGMIGIDFQSDARGEITIQCCYFSQFYSPQVCQIISSLDEGLLAGLTGGGRLTFSARITEGAPRCRACFVTRRSA
jgi:hypothetical protein